MMGKWARIRRGVWSTWWRKTVVVVVALVALYAALGFLLVPAVVAWQLPKQVAAHTTATAHIGKVRFNPFTFDFRASGFDMRSKAGQPLLSFKHLDINFDLSTLVNGAYTFAWIRLEQPRVNVTVDKSGKLNFMQLVPPATQPKEKTGQQQLPVVRIEELAVNGGRVAYADQSESRDFHLQLRSLNFDLQHFSTQPDAEGQYRLNATLGEGQTLAWKGSIGINPLTSKGELGVSGLKLAQFWPYVAKRFKVTLQSGQLGVQADYSMSEGKSGLQLLVRHGQIGLTQLALVGAADGRPLISVPKLEVGGVQVNLAKRTLGIDTVTTRDAQINATLDADHQLDLVQLLQPVDVASASRGPQGPPPPDAGSDTQASRSAKHASHASASVAGLEPGASPQTTVSPVQQPAGDGAPDVAVQAKVTAKPAATKPFAISVREVKVQNYGATLTDASGAKPVVFDVKPINLSVKGYSSTNDKPVKLSADLGLNGGTLSAQGELALDPLAAQVKLKLADLPISPFQPYIGRFANVKVKGGNVSVGGKISYKGGAGKSDGAAADISFDGHASLHGLDVDDSIAHQPFVRLGDLSVQGIHYASQPAGVSIQTVTIDKPFARVIIEADHSTNIAAVLSPPGETKAAPPDTRAHSTAAKDGAASMPVTVHQVTVKHGSLKFADRSIKPHVAVGIEALHGGVSNFSTKPGTVAKVDLLGKVNEFAPVTIKGSVSPIGKALSADIGVQFKNLGLTAFSPYSGKFAGYRIRKGKANLTLHYKLADGLLQGKNNVVLNQLELGKRVDSPDAVHLPLRLALALLKDSHGVIQLDLPVHGDLNNPQFAIGPLIGKALVHVLKKIVTSPFHLLASLVTGSADKLDHVSFGPGQAVLNDAQKASLTKLGKALKKRPKLELEISGVAVPSLDKPALAKRQLLARIRKGETPPTTSDTLTPADQERLLGAYKAMFHADADAAIARKPDEDDAHYHARVVQAAYARLLGQVQLPAGALQQLAEARADAVRRYLVQQGALDPSHIFMIDPDADAEAYKGGVRLPLQVRAG